MQVKVVLLIVLVVLFVAQGVIAAFEPIKGFKDVAEIHKARRGVTARGYTEEYERKRRRDVGDTETCLSFCDIPFTICNMIDFPIWPIGLNVSESEATVAAQIAVIPSGFVTVACKEALTEFGCARSYFSCSSNSDGSITQILPCRSVCTNVHSLCPSIVTSNAALDCDANNDDGTPRYSDDESSCFVMHSLSDPAHKSCPGSAPFDLDSVLANTTLSLEEVTLVGALWSNTNGPLWTKKAGWPEGDPCGWLGITCAINPLNSSALTITEIKLRDNNLQGTLPASFGEGVQNLQYVDLTLNKIAGQLPSSIGSITTLTHLEIAENQLFGTIPSTYGQLVNLEYLSLGSQEIEADALIRLSYAPVRTNTLTGTFDPTIFSPMTKLTYLNLGYNAFSGVLPSEIGDMVTLVSLDLMSNKFSGIEWDDL